MRVITQCLLSAALLFVSVVGCGREPRRPPLTADQPLAVPDGLNDGSASMDSCGRLRAHFAERQTAILRGAYRATVADVSAWRLGGRFPEAVPQFLAARPGNAVVHVCFVDMDIAKGPPLGPSNNRAVWLVDASSDETSFFMSGFHNTPGFRTSPWSRSLTTRGRLPGAISTPPSVHFRSPLRWAVR